MRLRAKAAPSLSSLEHEQLRAWTLRPKIAEPTALRAQIVRECAQGLTKRDIAARLHTGAQTVTKWRQRFIEQRCIGLLDTPRSRMRRAISDAQV